MEASQFVVCNGIDEAEMTGAAVAFVGDLNGDGFDDFAIGAPGAAGADEATPLSGETFVVFGSSNLGASEVIDLSSLDGTNGFVVHGQAFNDQSGFSVAGAGDFNGDGFDNFIIGAPFRAASTSLKAGVSYVLFGRS